MVRGFLLWCEGLRDRNLGEAFRDTKETKKKDMRATTLIPSAGCLTMTATIELLVLLFSVSSFTIVSCSSISLQQQSPDAAVGMVKKEHGFIMPWMCLERCGFSATDATAQIAELEKHKDVVRMVSFEWYQLSQNASVVDNNFTKVDEGLHKAGFITVAMLCSADLNHMREAFTRPFDVAGALLEAVLAPGRHIDGINVDFEPTDAATTEDAKHYAAFLRHLKSALNSAGGRFLSADIAEWNKLWNFTELSQALVQDQQQQTTTMVKQATPFHALLIPMSTYTYVDRYFVEGLKYSLQTIDDSLLVVGMDTWSNAPSRFNSTLVQQHLELVAATKRVCRLGIWMTPLPSFWWPLLGRFVNATADHCDYHGW